jgi:ATP-dependent DNA ligase
LPQDTAARVCKRATVSLLITAMFAMVCPVGVGVSQDQRAVLEKTFEFYERVNHAEKQPFERKYCVPPSYRILDVSVRETTKNGNTRFEGYTFPRGEPNCVVVRATIEGKGVRKIGGIVVDQLGRGWLGLEIVVKFRE